MKSLPPLVLVPRPSRRAVVLIASTHLATAALILWLPAPLPARLMALAAIVIWGGCAVRKVAGPGLPHSIRVGIDRRIAVMARDGRETCGEIVAGSYVGPHVTTIVWRPDGAWCMRTLLVLSDTFAGDDFRRLRVVLRYGLVPVRGGGSNDDVAG